MTDFIRQMGRRIKDVRKAAGMTQEKLAAKTSLSEEFLSRLERGVVQPSLKSLDRIASSLNVSVKDLFEFNQPIIFRGKKNEARQRKQYLELIGAELKERDLRDLAIVISVLKGLKGNNVFRT